MLLNMLKKIMRRVFLPTFSFEFIHTNEPSHIAINETNLYIHIPFCRHLCPYCPYNKIEFDKTLIAPYFEALKQETNKILNVSNSPKIINSIYIGGGSPAIVAKELSEYLDYLRKIINPGEICIELNPLDCSEENITILKKAGITQISLGVQSFNSKFLNFIGRKYDEQIIDAAIKTVKKAQFKSINIDIMFALSDQTGKELVSDLQKAILYDVDQVTNYPLFTFPYTSIGKYLKIKKVKMPDLGTRKKLYNLVYDFFTENNYQPVSVWSFVKGNKPKYSSVTRDNYIGLGAGAGTHADNGFYLNTFDVLTYISRCSEGRFPTALCLNFTEEANNYFRLYWKFYEGIINLEYIRQSFKNSLRIRFLVSAIVRLKLGYIENNHLIMNKKGYFWIHLAQNHYSLSYINKIWSKAMKEPFPKKISF